MFIRGRAQAATTLSVRPAPSISEDTPAGLDPRARESLPIMSRTHRPAEIVHLIVLAGGLTAALGSFVWATAGDKPLWKEKGKPTGSVHGGADGQPFKDRAWGRLAEVSVWGGSWLDSVRCSWEDEGEVVKGDTHGGDGGDETVVKLESGEALIQVSGVLLEQGDQTVVGSLTLKTTKRTVGPIGKTLDGPKFTLDAPKGQEICGFQGRSGDYLVGIGMMCRPRP